MLLCRTGLVRCSTGVLWTNRAKPGLSRTRGILTPLRSLAPHASVKSSYALQPHEATLVLPGFARSCPADESTAAKPFLNSF